VRRSDLNEKCLFGDRERLKSVGRLLIRGVRGVGQVEIEEEE
jgi:hypothetical protein